MTAPDLKFLKRKADLMKKLARSVVALEDLARDGWWLGLSEVEMKRIKRAYIQTNNVLYKLEQSGIEKEFLDAGLLNEE